MPLDKRSNKTFKYGLVTSIEAQTIPRGAASSSLNWLTKGDMIELRRGWQYMGSSSVNTGNGFITGLKRVIDALGVEQLFKTYGQKLKYWNRTTEEWVENGSNLLGSAVVDANGLGLEDISLEEYVGLAGYQLFVNSPNCANVFKVMIANKDDSSSVYLSTKNYKMHIKIDTSRTFGWLRNEDDASLYVSYIDTQTYTTVTGEATTSLSGTLAFKAAGTRRTCFAVTITITASGEVYSGNFNGALTGTLGGTGTINYTTGAYTLSNAGVGTADYQWEDSTNNGILDFTKSSPRTAGQGILFLQSDGGRFLGLEIYKNTQYCFHVKKTWEVSLTATDTAASNLPYRERVGLPSTRAKVATGDGIYYIDSTDKNDTKARLLTYDIGGSQQVIPVPISNNLNLNDYIFDKAVGFQYGDLVLFACATKNSTRTVNSQTVALNNRTLAYNTLWKSWDVLDYAVTIYEVFDGALIGGDSYSNNVMEMFSGFDDDGNTIPNHWIGKLDDLDIDGLKKSKKLVLEGLIAPEQKIKVSMSIDNGPFVEVGGSDSSDTPSVHTYAIQGDGAYVDRTQSVNVGAQTLGRGEVGGGSGGVTAYMFERCFNLELDKFETIQIKFEAMDIGYVAVSTYQFFDIRQKGQKVALKYRT